MKKTIRLLGVLLTVVIILSGLSSCSTSKDNDKQAGKDDKSIPTLTWYLPGSGQDDMQMVQDAANKIIEPKIGARVSIQFIDTGSFQDKMTMIIASNKNFDLCFTSDWTNLFRQTVSKGGFMPINDIIDKNAPKLKTVLPNYIWNAATINGKIYAVPNLQVLFIQTSLVFMKKYVDKYNFDVSKVKSVYDIEPFLKQVKEGEPNVFPYRPNYSTAVFNSPLFEEIQPTGYGVKKDGSDNKLYNIGASDESKKGQRLLHQWFLKGYIRPDVASVMDDNEDLAAGKYAVYQAVYKPGAEAEDFIKLKQRVVYVPIEKPYLKSNAGMPAMTAVSRTCTNPDKAIKLLELVNTDKVLFNLLSFGIEGKHYKKISDSQIDEIEKSGYEPNAAWEFGNQFNAFYLKDQTPGIWELTQKLNDTAMKSPLAGFTFNTEPVKTEIAQCSTIDNEYSGLCNGSEDADKVDSTRTARYIAAGAEKIHVEVQKQYDEWCAKKK